MVNILENRNLRKNNILYWGRTRVTTLNNSVKPKRIRSISSVKKKTHNPQRCACSYILQRVAA